MPTISLQGIQKSYGGTATPAVQSLDLVIEDGEFMCLLGPSGCGKTTTLRMICGLEQPTAGRISVGDRVLDEVSGGVFVPPEKREMGLAFQSYALWPHLTIERNVDFGLRLRKTPKAEMERRTEEVMRKLGIDRYRDRYPSQLSGGQQQRVALARMLVVEPDVLLLDEPLSNLDSKLRLEMRAELKRIHDEFKTTVVFVTHDQWEAMTLATTIAVMSEGLLQQVGTPDEIYSRPANRFVAEFVGNPPINVFEFGEERLSAAASRAASYVEGLALSTRAGSLGVRPESIRVSAPDAPVPDGAFGGLATVRGVLPTGGSWIVELDAEGTTVYTTTSIPPTVRAGDRAAFWAAREELHIFDAAGDRITEGER